MKRLIVNADDFGLHQSVNQGIRNSHLQGIVTSASLMAGGAAFAEAVGIAQECSRLGVGVHLALVGGRPVLPAGEVPSLVDDQGCFFASYSLFLTRYLSGRISLAEIERELAAQIAKVRLAGISPSHLDSHQHLHVMPGISQLVLSLARRFSIRAIRIPAESALFFSGMQPSFGRVLGRTGLTLLAGLCRQQAAAAGIVTADRFFGMLAGGNLTEPKLIAILNKLPAGVSEIMTHPAAADDALASDFDWGYHWEQEGRALSSAVVRALTEEKQIQLISFREL